MEQHDGSATTTKWLTIEGKWHVGRKHFYRGENERGAASAVWSGVWHVIPDFVSKIKYSSYVCQGSFILHTQT
jgi:hypothetical protein